MSLFDRIASLTVGEKGNENGISFSDFRISFSIKKTANTESNTADIEIYNLSETTRELFSNIDNIVTLQAGYRQYEGEKILFVGNILDYSTKKQKADIILKLKLGDGSKELTEKTFSKSYKPGTSGWTVLDDIIKKLGLPKNVTSKISNLLSSKNDQYANALSMTGLAKDQMSKIMKKLNLEYSVQNGKIKIMELDGTDDENIVFLDADSGLIGQPIKKTKKIKHKKVVGYDIRSLLRPELEPGSKILINSFNIDNSLFRVDSIDHIGDNYGQEWASEMFCREVGI